jgi:hypothetical protein
VAPPVDADPTKDVDGDPLEKLPKDSIAALGSVMKAIQRLDTDKKASATGSHSGLKRDAPVGENLAAMVHMTKEVVATRCGARSSEFLDWFKVTLVANSDVWAGRTKNKFLPASADPEGDHRFYSQIAAFDPKATEEAKDLAMELARMTGKAADVHYIEACSYLNDARLKVADLALRRHDLTGMVRSAIVNNKAGRHNVEVITADCDVLAAKKRETGIASHRLKAWYATHKEKGERCDIHTYEGAGLLPKLLSEGYGLAQKNTQLILSMLRTAYTRLMANLEGAIPPWHMVDPSKPNEEDPKFLPWLKLKVRRRMNAIAAVKQHRWGKLGNCITCKFPFHL